MPKHIAMESGATLPALSVINNSGAKEERKLVKNAPALNWKAAKISSSLWLIWFSLRKKRVVELPASVLCVLAIKEMEQTPGIPISGFKIGLSHLEAANNAPKCSKTATKPSANITLGTKVKAKIKPPLALVPPDVFNYSGNCPVSLL